MEEKKDTIRKKEEKKDTIRKKEEKKEKITLGSIDQKDLISKFH